MSQSKRNGAWHSRHTKKKAAKKRSRINYMISGGRERSAMARKMIEADKKFKEAQEREAEKKVGITGWFFFGFKRIWSKIKSVFKVATSFHSNNQQDVQTQS